MVVIAPFAAAAALGGLDAGMGILGGILGNNAQKQEYTNQVAFQSANRRFASWQAGFSKKIADANSQWSFWQQTLQHNQELAYVNSLRNVELTKSIEQARRVEENRIGAAADYANTSDAITQQLAEVQIADAVAWQQYQMQVIKGRSRLIAGDQSGATVDRLIADFDRQQGDWETIQAINMGLKGRQFSRQQAGAVAQYLNQYNSQQFYAEQPYLEPMAPFQPLPTLLAPPAPSMIGSRPGSGAASALQIGGSLLGGVRGGMSAFSGLSALAGGGRANPAASTTR